MILVKSRRLDWAYVLGLATILLGAELIVLHSGTKKSWSTGLTASLWLLPIGILLAVLVGVEPSTNRLYWRFGRRVRQARASIDPYSLGHMYPWLDGRDQRSAPSCWRQRCLHTGRQGWLFTCRQSCLLMAVPGRVWAWSVSGEFGDGAFGAGVVDEVLAVGSRGDERCGRRVVQLSG